MGKRHGMRYSKTYTSWLNMMSRCENALNKAYKNYGGRGITYDPAWVDFRVFYADMGEAPVGMELDRRDNEAGYSKGNCRWVTRHVNSRNKRTNRYVSAGGETLCIQDWAKVLDVNQATIFTTAKRKGLSLEQEVLRRIA